jgi:hypothetical protein
VPHVAVHAACVTSCQQPQSALYHGMRSDACPTCCLSKLAAGNKRGASGLPCSVPLDAASRCHQREAATM